MNMLPAEIAANGSAIIAAGTSLPLDPRNGVASAEGTKVTPGIRREDITVVAAGVDAQAAVDAS